MYQKAVSSCAPALSELLFRCAARDNVPLTNFFCVAHPVAGGEGAPGSGHTYDHTRLPFTLVERASKATRQRGPPPQGSTASHKRYDMGGDTPSPCRHRHPQNPAG